MEIHVAQRKSTEIILPSVGTLVDKVWMNERLFAEKGLQNCF